MLDSPSASVLRMKAKGFPAKKATNVSIRSDLLEAAREAKLNLSATLERALIEELRRAQRERWREENREAIAAHNDFVEKHGAFSDDLRSF
ncbi:MAG TPA: type II toxin-antitoxin system CcdA family antitoxin [Gammaproteobacteria bacterium]|nr:type II toxin-antitoxin system CcdA family antitoxin [Gammaproteobacteria bacterium]